MRAFAVVGVALLAVGCSAPPADQPVLATEAAAATDADLFSFPAEWEPHDAVWVGWVPPREGRPERHEVMNAMTVDIIGALRGHVRVEVIVRDEEAAAEVEARLRDEGVWSGDLTFRYHDFPDFWMRDPGPLFLRNAAGEVKVADFRWNSYGLSVGDTEVSERAQALDDYEPHFAEVLGLEVVSTDMVSEGGGMTVNGRGTMMATKWTALQRNPEHTLEEIEAEYLRVMGQRKMVWLERSLIEDLYLDGPIAENYTGGGANGHLDEYARFVGPSTVLLAEISQDEIDDNPVNAINYEVLEENYRVLQNATDQDGNPFEIIRVPMPEVDPLRREYELSEREFQRDPGFAAAGFAAGDTMFQVAAASYLNYLVTNEVVLIASYWEEGLPDSQHEKDEQALEIFQRLFPDRDIIQLRPLGINYFGGGVHCATQQQPAGLPDR